MNISVLFLARFGNIGYMRSFPNANTTPMFSKHMLYGSSIFGTCRIADGIAVDPSKVEVVSNW